MGGLGCERSKVLIMTYLNGPLTINTKQENMASAGQSTFMNFTFLFFVVAFFTELSHDLLHFT